jgi:cell division protein FtsB
VRLLAPTNGRWILPVVALSLAAAALFFPARALMDQRGDVEVLEARLEALREENERLEREAHRLGDPAELEVLARERLGLVRPGEQAYVIEPTDPEPHDTDEGAGASVFSRAWEWIRSLVRGSG